MRPYTWGEILSTIILFVFWVWAFWTALGGKLVYADEVYTNRVEVLIGSYHEDREANYNENNLGLFYSHYYSPERDFIFAGRYHNSEYQMSNAIGVGKQWKINSLVDVGFTIGAVTGYKRGTTPFMLPSITLYDTVVIRGIPFKGGVISLSLIATTW